MLNTESTENKKRRSLVATNSKQESSELLGTAQMTAQSKGKYCTLFQ